MFTDTFATALAFAARTHREQTRKGADIPYVSHLMAVSALVIEHGGDEVQAIAALLHDAVEDQGGAAMAEEIAARFGPEVAEIVLHCTDACVVPKPEWRARKEAYIASLAGKPHRSLLVSLADKLHNATPSDAIWPRMERRFGTGSLAGALERSGTIARWRTGSRRSRRARWRASLTPSSRTSNGRPDGHPCAARLSSGAWSRSVMP